MARNERGFKSTWSDNYSIFLDEKTDRLFAYVEVEDKAIYDKIAETEICQKWWEYMAPIMKSNPNNSPVAVDLKEVFYLA